MRLQTLPKSVTVDKMAGIFAKRIWQPYISVTDVWRSIGSSKHFCFVQLLFLFGLIRIFLLCRIVPTRLHFFSASRSARSS